MTTLESFEQLIATHGSDLDRWPEGERLSAQQLLTHSVEAKALFAEQQTIDALLDAIPVPSMAAMEKRIVRNLATASRSSLGSCRVAATCPLWLGVQHFSPACLLSVASIWPTFTASALIRQRILGKKSCT